MVPLYPDIGGLANWTVSANRVVSRDIYPDARDNETVVYKWGLADQEVDSFVTDLFRIIGALKILFPRYMRFFLRSVQ